jgi:long-subunit fatty acid transport protein
MRRVWVGLVCCLLIAAPAAAQSNVEVNQGVQFDFLSPGARSLAMGGAFIGMADDATAAFVNPAGLRALTRKEVSFEGRGRDFEIPVVARGRLGRISNERFDVIEGLDVEPQGQTGGGASFLSFVYPQARWAIAGYRHELANIDIDVVTDGAFFRDFTAPEPSTQFRLFPIRGSMSLDIISYGVAGSFNVTPQFSVGAGLAVHDFEMRSRTDRYDFNNTVAAGNLCPPAPQPCFYDPPVFAELANYQEQNGDDTQIGFNVGALFAPSRQFQVGVVFRQGPDFETRVTNNDPDTGQPFLNRDFAGNFRVPHVLGFGAVYRPVANGTIAVDVARVQYSRLTEDFVDVFNDVDSPQNQGPSYSVNDATEVHAGFEYVFPRRIPIAVRVGYWLDPEHGIRYEPSQAALTEFVTRNSNLALSEIFRPREEDEHHFTAGGGAVFGRFEINAGVDTASRVTTVSLSAVVRF